MKGKKYVAAVAVVALLGGGGWWYTARAKSAAAQNQVRYVEGTVKRGNIHSTISGSGPVAAVNGVTWKATQGGTVTQVLAQDGDQVKAGQVLMVLDSPTLQASLNQAQNDVQNQQRSLDNLFHPSDTSVQGQQLKVDSARLTLNQRLADQASLMVKAPAAGVVTAVSAQEGGIANPRDLLAVITPAAGAPVEVRAQVAGSVTQVPQVGQRVAAGDQLVQLSNESLALQVKQAQNEVRSQEQALTNLANPTADTSDPIRQAQQKLDSARTTLASRQQDVADLQVKAPVDGKVSGLTARVGDRIAQGQQLFRVADYGAMQVTISVDELDIAKVKAGQAAEIALDAVPGKQYAGKVTKVNPEGVLKNDIATFEVTVSIENPEGLMAGMNATVNVVVEDKQDVLWLPAQAVQTRQGKSFVQTLVNGKPTPKEVETGLKTTQQVEIVGGLTEGEKVVVSTIKPSQASGTQGSTATGLFGRGMGGTTGGGTMGGGTMGSGAGTGSSTRRSSGGTGGTGGTGTAGGSGGTQANRQGANGQ